MSGSALVTHRSGSPMSYSNRGGHMTVVSDGAGNRAGPTPAKDSYGELRTVTADPNPKEPRTAVLAIGVAKWAELLIPHAVVCSIVHAGGAPVDPPSR